MRSIVAIGPLKGLRPLFFVLVAVAAGLPAWLAGPADAQVAEPDLRAIAAELFGIPAVEVDVGPAEGEPASTAVFRNGQLIGYLASTWKVARSVGYSGKPVDILVAVGKQGIIEGARLVEQSEPVLVIGISEKDLAAFVERFAGTDLNADSVSQAGKPPAGLPDALSGATVSSAVMRDSILRTARTVALARGLIGDRDKQRIDRSTFAPASWQELVSEGAIARRTVTIGQANKALGLEPTAEDQETFIALDTALVTPPKIGQNLLGQLSYTELVAGLGANDSAILVAGTGLYSFKGTRYRQSQVFDRIELIQGSLTLRLTAENYRNIESLAAPDAPDYREIALFVIPGASGFDPTLPWRINLLASRAIPGGALALAQFAFPYQLPDQYVVKPIAAAADGGGLFTHWLDNWRSRLAGIAVIVVMLGILSAILVFQDWIAERYRLYRIVRLSFLAATLFLLGWWLGAQLSVVHVISFVQALLTGFSWELFLLDPFVFILWSFVALALLFWGRGVFCGWLCPFGALQELLSEIARKVGIRQINVSFALHERLWPVKYILFLGLFAISLNSVTLAFTGAEIEPFKTVITLKFMREWQFVAYALILLGIGLFIERFYCRYLCPLGGALAIPARLRMFDWLKRRPQCGTECGVCARRCTVQAIHPDGHINPNECIHCLNCQMLYYDERTCPPLIERAKRRKRREEVAARRRAEEAAGAPG